MLLLIFTIFFLIPELVLRLLDPRGQAELAQLFGVELQGNYIDDAVLGHKPRDEYYFWDDKDHLPLREKPEDTVRIFAMGDSFVKAHKEIGLENSFYRVASRLLAEKKNGSRFEWFHFGISGYCERQHLELIKRYGPIYKPDVVLIQVYLGNDVGENIGFIRQELHKIGDQLKIRNNYYIPDEKQGQGPPLLQAFIERSYLANSLAEKLNSLGWVLGLNRFSNLPGNSTTNHTLDLMQSKPKHYIEDAWKTTEDLVAAIKKMTDDCEAKLLFALIPKELQVNAEEATQVFKMMNLNPAEFDTNLPNRRFSEILSKHGIPCLDITPVFRRKIADGVVLYDGHFNKEGHKVFGEALVKAMEEQGIIF
ncbi:MAG: hypothetical protein ABIK28_04315 [Planctomycetota bacterium]